MGSDRAPEAPLTIHDVADLLRNARESAALSVLQAAEATQRGRWSLYRWEKAKGLDTVAEVWDYLEQLGYDVTIRKCATGRVDGGSGRGSTRGDG